MKLSGRDLHQTLKDLDGKAIIEYLRPEPEEIEKAIEEGRAETMKPIKVYVTPYYMIRSALRKDLTMQTAQGRTPDPHESKKMELFELLVKVSDTQVDTPELILKSEEVTMIKKRAEQMFPTEWYGRLMQVMKETEEEKSNSAKNKSLNKV